MTRLSSGQRWALAFAVAVVAAGMAMGFLSSFLTLYHAAQANAWPYPWRLPLSVDSGILAYVVLDQIAVASRWRSRWLHTAAWGLAAFTVWANAAAATTGGAVWRVIDAAMPGLWVLGVEALRFTWHRLHADPAEEPDRIPAGRWIASPLPTLLLWRRMRLLGVTSWPLMCAMEDARVFLRDSVRAVRSRHDVPVPLSVRRAIRTGRFPGEVSERIRSSLSYGGAATWEPSMESWLASRLGLSSTLSEALSNDRQQPTPDTSGAPPAAVPGVPAEIPAGAPSGSASEKPPGGAPQRAPRSARQGTARSAVEEATRIARKQGSRKVPRDLLAEAVRELFGGGQPVTVYRITKTLPVGEATAKALLAEVQAQVDAERRERLQAVAK